MSLELTLGVGGEAGPLGGTATVRSPSDLRLFAEFRNPGLRPLSALIDATPLANGGYQLEVTDAAGGPAGLRGMGRCGTLSPLLEHEIFTVRKGETARTPVGLGPFRFAAPGVYRLRIRYEAHVSDLAEGARDPVVAQRLEQLWTGTLLSDWISITVQSVS